MSGPLRIEYAGALYHVTSRGDERKPIYREEVDFELFLDILSETCARFNWVRLFSGSRLLRNQQAN